MKQLLERIEQKRDALDRLADDKASALRTGTLKEIQDILDDRTLAQGLRQDIQTFSEFRAISLPVGLTNASAVESKLSQLIGSTNPEAKAVQYYRLAKELRDFRSQLHSNLTDAWSSHIDQNTVAVGNIPEALARIPDYGSILNTIRQAQSGIAQLRSELPRKQAEIQRFHQLNGELQRALDELENRCPKDVQEFIRRCAANGADLSSLADSSIRDWIESNKLGDSLCVKFRQGDSLTRA